MWYCCEFIGFRDERRGQQLSPIDLTTNWKVSSPFRYASLYDTWGGVCETPVSIQTAAAEANTKRNEEKAHLPTVKVKRAREKGFLILIVFGWYLCVKRHLIPSS
jgi:hypothetical protein